MMDKNLIYVRVLEQDTCDQIRMGQAFPIWEEEMEKAVQSTIDQYGKQLAWCGGFKAGCEKYYQRIALVNAETLQGVAEIWNRD